jgi:hypothetical protein
VTVKARPLIILALVLAALVGLKYIQDRRHQSQLERSGLDALMPALPADQIGRIRLTGPGGEDVVLAQSGGEWVVETSYGHRADAAKIERLTADLAGLKGEFRSDKEAVLADYGLVDSTAIRMEIFDLSGQSRAALLLGDRAPTGAGFFVRKEGEMTAYAAGGNLLGNLGVWGDNRDPEGKRFLDLKVMAAERDAVDRLWFRDGEREVELVKAFPPAELDSTAIGGEAMPPAAPDRSQFTWMLNGAAARESSANAVLGAVTSIWARDLLDPAADYDFAGSAKSAGFVLADGTRKTLEFGAEVAEPETGVALRVKGEDGVFLVPSSLLDRIFKDDNEFEPEEG